MIVIIWSELELAEGSCGGTLGTYKGGNLGAGRNLWGCLSGVP